VIEQPPPKNWLLVRRIVALVGLVLFVLLIHVAGGPA
jgi:hypothetical protein